MTKQNCEIDKIGRCFRGSKHWNHHLILHSSRTNRQYACFFLTIGMLLPLNMHAFTSQFASYSRPFCTKRRYFPFKLLHLFMVLWFFKSYNKLKINKITKHLYFSHIFSAWASWLKKRPAFVLKSRCSRSHSTEERSVW